jgi:uncharacterized membrane protein
MLVEQAVNWQIEAGEWSQLAITYKTLSHKIAHLLLANGGVTRDMSDTDYAYFRQLAMRRDLVSHVIQTLEYNSLNE